MNVEDDLAGLKKFLAALEQPEMRLIWNNRDVTDREVATLKHEIGELEQLLAKLRA